MQNRCRFVAALLSAVVMLPALGEASQPIEFDSLDGKLAIRVGKTTVATYSFKDPDITRPYFANVRTQGGVQVTRPHPPVEGQDVADHPLYHPGIWLAFGDISGSDCWRLKAPVVHAEFVKQPSGGSQRGGFAVRNRYVDQHDSSREVCEEVASYSIVTRPEGYFILWDSTFTSEREFYFGDQEEMGLGFRIASQVRAERKVRDGVPGGNGLILDSEGRRNGDEIWGNTADWADYSGVLKNRLVGITIFCHPENFRPSWFHARDYGLLEANPFGREAFGKGTKSQVHVAAGESFRLRYGLFIHETAPDNAPDLADAYANYLALTRP